MGRCLFGTPTIVVWSVMLGIPSTLREKPMSHPTDVLCVGNVGVVTGTKSVLGWAVDGMGSVTSGEVGT